MGIVESFPFITAGKPKSPTAVQHVFILSARKRQGDTSGTCCEKQPANERKEASCEKIETIEQEKQTSLWCGKGKKEARCWGKGTHCCGGKETKETNRCGGKETKETNRCGVKETKETNRCGGKETKETHRCGGKERSSLLPRRGKKKG
jgi:hypothetical protein